ncbi:MAG: UDP-N-acetylmuramoyl-L-alanine--D-glutamate ligase [Patescibacteria group bacterium]
MKIGIVGWGIEGQSAFHYFGPDHDYLIVNEHPRDDFPGQSDKIKVQFLTEEKPPGITSNVTDLSYLDGIEKCEKIVYSVTSIKNLEQKFGQDKNFWKKATTVWHIFFENVKTKNLIGVTGSKGKGTTSTLIYEMLKAAGKNVFLAGNIGVSVLDILPKVKETDWVVLEITNYQLYNFPYSPHIAVCLMITKEHLDWHPNMEEYISAKTNLFSHQKKDDIAIYFADNELSQRIAGSSPGIKIPYFAPPGAVAKNEGVIAVGDPETEVIDTREIKLIGEHNLQNICAAVTVVWQITPDVKAIHKVLAAFSGLPHRLEFVREVDGVKYYDDSFGTTPQTAIVAMRALIQPQVLILGGSDKGLDFGPMIDEVVKDRTRHVITIGQTGPKIEQMLRNHGFDKITAGLDKMTDIVAEARRVAGPGDVVLLSTGCASFGLFHDYKDRGNQFKNAVNKLV